MQINNQSAASLDHLTSMFVHVDDFLQYCDEVGMPFTLRVGNNHNRAEPQMSMSEVITILLFFQTAKRSTFKDYYNLDILEKYRKEFPHSVSYSRFISYVSRANNALMWYAYYLTYGGRRQACKFHIIDSTAIPVCAPLRANWNRVFKDSAQFGKNSRGWFYGFKLHLVVDAFGAIEGFTFTPGNMEDRHKQVATVLLHDLKGTLLGDLGYRGPRLFEQLLEQGLLLLFPKQEKIFPLEKEFSKSILRKRSLVESVFRISKTMLPLAHSRHRSVQNAMVHFLASLCSYQLLPKHPTISMPEIKKYSVSP